MISANSHFYELRKAPRGRIVRCVPTSGDEYSKHVAECSPLTNLQRAVEMAKTLGWLDPSISIHDLNYAI